MTDEWDHQIDAFTERAVAAAADRAPIVGVATTSDQLVTVEVAPGGALLALHLHPSATKRDLSGLAADIVALTAVAAQRATEHTHQSAHRALDAHACDALSTLGLPTPTAQR